MSDFALGCFLFRGKLCFEVQNGSLSGEQCVRAGGVATCGPGKLHHSRVNEARWLYSTGIQVSHGVLGMKGIYYTFIVPLYSLPSCLLNEVKEHTDYWTASHNFQHCEKIVEQTNRGQTSWTIMKQLLLWAHPFKS